MGFQDGCAVIHDAGQVGIGEADAVEGRGAQDLSRGWLAVLAEEKAGLGAQIGMAPAVQNYAGDIALGIESDPPNIMLNCSRIRFS